MAQRRTTRSTRTRETSSDNLLDAVKSSDRLSTVIVLAVLGLAAAGLAALLFAPQGAKARKAITSTAQKGVEKAGDAVNKVKEEAPHLVKQVKDRLPHRGNGHTLKIPG
jgi:gas vesicle protein